MFACFMANIHVLQSESSSPLSPHVPATPQGWSDETGFMASRLRFAWIRGSPTHLLAQFPPAVSGGKMSHSAGTGGPYSGHFAILSVQMGGRDWWHVCMWVCGNRKKGDKQQINLSLRWLIGPDHTHVGVILGKSKRQICLRITFTSNWNAPNSGKDFFFLLVELKRYTSAL